MVNRAPQIIKTLTRQPKTLSGKHSNCDSKKLSGVRSCKMYHQVYLKTNKVPSNESIVAGSRRKIGNGGF